jgi:hypothetical protein
MDLDNADIAQAAAHAECRSGPRVAGDQMSEWRWARTYQYEAGGRLTFARGAAPADVIEAFELDPARAVLVPEEQVDQTLRYPVVDRHSGELIGPWIRAGRSGEWAFAIEPFPMDATGEAGRRLSFFWGEAVVILWTPTVNTATYFADGEEVTKFQPEMACYRYGHDPDRFVAQMRQAGLDIDELTDEEYEAEGPALSEREERYIHTDHVLATLDMFTLALGIRLPVDVAAGPLLTVQRIPPGHDN